MSELIWINGEVMPLADARVGVEDRGFQFADGVYETLRLYNGRPFAIDRHLNRLEKSAAAISISIPLDKPTLTSQMQQLCERSGICDGMLYLQLTRGNARRNHLFPPNVPPTLLFYVREIPPSNPIGSGPGQKLIAVPEERWKKCWIKSLALLPNVLARNAAAAAGADEAAFVEDGFLSECSSSNLFAVIDGTLVTPPIGPRVLPGITREILLTFDVPCQERSLRYEEACAADELFITSTIREVAWVSIFDGRTIGDGKIGPITRRLHEMFRRFVENDLISRAT